jgi:hypothetical protein
MGEPKSSIFVTKTNTCNGNGAQNDAIFLVTGTVKILELYGIVTEATEATVLQACSWAFNVQGGGSPASITEIATGTDCSGVAVGDFLVKNAAVASGLTKVVATAPKLTTPSGESIEFYLTAQQGTATNIYFKFTGAVATDVDIQFFCRYMPRSAGSSVVAA